MTAVDSKATIVDCLRTSGTDLFTLIDARSYIQSIPDAIDVTTQACVVWFRTAGAPVVRGDWDEGIYTFRCYGGLPTGRKRHTNADAEAVAVAVEDRLHSKYGKPFTAGTIYAGRTLTRADSWDSSVDPPVPMIVIVIELRIQ